MNLRWDECYFCDSSGWITIDADSEDERWAYCPECRHLGVRFYGDDAAVEIAMALFRDIDITAFSGYKTSDDVLNEVCAQAALLTLPKGYSWTT